MATIKKYATVTDADGVSKTKWVPFSSTDASDLSTNFVAEHTDGTHSYKSIQQKLQEQDNDINQLKRNVAWLALHGGGGGTGGGGSGGGSTSNVSCTVKVGNTGSLIASTDESNPKNLYLKPNNSIVIKLDNISAKTNIAWNVTISLAGKVITKTATYSNPEIILTWDSISSLFTNYSIANVRIIATYTDDDNARYSDECGWYGNWFNCDVSLSSSKTSYQNPYNSVTNDPLRLTYNFGQSGTYNIDFDVYDSAGNLVLPSSAYDGHTYRAQVNNPQTKQEFSWKTIFGIAVTDNPQPGSYTVKMVMYKSDDTSISTGVLQVACVFTTENVIVSWKTPSNSPATATVVNVYNKLNMAYTVYSTASVTFDYEYVFKVNTSKEQVAVLNGTGLSISDPVNQYFSIESWAKNLPNSTIIEVSYRIKGSNGSEEISGQPDSSGKVIAHRYIKLDNSGNKYLTLHEQSDEENPQSTKEMFCEFNSRSYDKGVYYFDLEQDQYKWSNKVECEMNMIHDNSLSCIHIDDDTGQPYLRLSNSAFCKIDNFKITPNGGTAQTKSFSRLITQDSNNPNWTISICFKADYHPDDNRTIFSVGNYDTDGSIINGIEINVHGIYIGRNKVAVLTDNTINCIDLVHYNDQSTSGNEVYVTKVYLNGVLLTVSSSEKDDVFENCGVSQVFFGGKQITDATSGITSNIYLCDCKIYNFQFFSNKLRDIDILTNYINNLTSTSFYIDSQGIASEDGRILQDQLEKNLAVIQDNELLKGYNTISSTIYGTNGYNIDAFLTTSGNGTLSVEKLNSSNATKWNIPIVLVDVSGTWRFDDFKKNMTLDEIEAATNCKVQYWDPIVSTKMFEFDVVTSIQGTSTKANPIKNINISIIGNKLFTPKKTWIPETTYTLKADIVDSSHSNNAAIGSFINNYLGYDENGNAKFFTVDQTAYDNIYTSDYHKIFQPTSTLKHTVEGFPVFLIMKFRSAQSSDLQTVPVGIYSFNLGRDSYRNLGFVKITGVTATSDTGSAITSISEFPFLANGKIDETDTAAKWVEIQATNSNSGMYSINTDSTTFPTKYLDHSADLTDSTLYNCQFIADFWQSDPTVLSKVFKTRYPEGDKIEEDNTFFKFVDQIVGLPIENNRTSDSEGKHGSFNIAGSYTKFIYSGGFIENGVNTTTTKDASEYGEATFDYVNFCKYFAIAMLFGLVDNFGKNVTFRKWSANGKYYVDFYDMDTALGGDNQGGLTITPDTWIKYLYNKTASDYSPCKNYNVGDLVYRWCKHSGEKEKGSSAKLFKCKVAITNASDAEPHPWNSSEWQRVSYASVIGNKMSGYKLGYASESWTPIEISTLTTSDSTTTTLSSSTVVSANHSKLWLSLDSDFCRKWKSQTGSTSDYSYWWWQLRSVLHSIRTSYNESYGTNYSNFIDFFTDQIFSKQAGDCGSLVYNFDYRIKYLLQFTPTDGAFDSSLISRIHGRRIEYCRYWLKKHILFLDSLFNWRETTSSRTGLIFKNNIDDYMKIGVYKTSSYLPITSNNPLIVSNEVGQNATSYYWIQENTPTYVNTGYLSSDSVIDWSFSNSSNIIELGNSSFNLSNMGVGYFNAPTPRYINETTKETASLDHTGLPALTEVMLAGNHYFTSDKPLPTEVFLETTTAVSELRTVDLNGCNIKDGIKGISFQLNLGDSRFSKLTKVDVGNCTELTSLSLPTVPLMYLDVHNTSITSITLKDQKYLDNMSFAGCSLLTYVELDNCDSFKEFNLSQTDSQNINTIILKNCDNLETISLTSCQKLKNVTISNCPNLKTIKITNCDALSADGLIIANTFSLESIDISESNNASFNKLTVQNLYNPHLLKTINLYNTNIKIIDGSIMYNEVSGYYYNNSFYLTKSGTTYLDEVTDMDISTIYTDRDTGKKYMLKKHYVSSSASSTATEGYYIDNEFYQLSSKWKKLIPVVNSIYKDKPTNNFYTWKYVLTEGEYSNRYSFETTYNSKSIIDVKKFINLTTLDIRKNSKVEQVEFRNEIDNPYIVSTSFYDSVISCSSLYRVFGNLKLNCSNVFTNCSVFSVHGSDNLKWKDKDVYSNKKYKTVWELLKGNDPKQYDNLTLGDIWCDGDYLTNLSFAANSGVLSYTFYKTNLTQFDVYYTLTAFALSETNLGTKYYSADYTFYTNNSLFTWSTTQYCYPDRYMFYKCGNISQLVNTFNSGVTLLLSPRMTFDTISGVTYGYVTKYKFGGSYNKDDGLFSPLKNLTKIHNAFNSNSVISKNIFRRNDNVKYPLSSITYFGSGLILDNDIVSVIDIDQPYDTSTQIKIYETIDITDSTNSYTNYVLFRDSFTNSDSRYKRLCRCTGSLNGFFDSISANNITINNSFGAPSLNYDSISFPVTLTSISHSFTSTYARGQVRIGNSGGSIRMFPSNSQVTTIVNSFNASTANNNYTNNENNGKVLMLINDDMFDNVKLLTYYGASSVTGDGSEWTSFNGSAIIKRLSNPISYVNNTTIPVLLQGLTNLTTFTAFFDHLSQYNEGEYLQIPGKLFLRNKQLGNIHRLMYDCNQPYKLTPNGFANCSNIKKLSLAFANSRSSDDTYTSSLRGEIPYHFLYHGKSGSNNGETIKTVYGTNDGTQLPSIVAPVSSITDWVYYQNNNQYITQTLKKIVTESSTFQSSAKRTIGVLINEFPPNAENLSKCFYVGESSSYTAYVCTNTTDSESSTSVYAWEPIFESGNKQINITSDLKIEMETKRSYSSTRIDIPVTVNLATVERNYGIDLSNCNIHISSTDTSIPNLDLYNGHGSIRYYDTTTTPSYTEPTIIIKFNDAVVLTIKSSSYSYTIDIENAVHAETIQYTQYSKSIEQIQNMFNGANALSKYTYETPFHDSDNKYVNVEPVTSVDPTWEGKTIQILDTVNADETGTFKVLKLKTIGFAEKNPDYVPYKYVYDLGTKIWSLRSDGISNNKYAGYSSYTGNPEIKVRILEKGTFDTDTWTKVTNINDLSSVTKEAGKIVYQESGSHKLYKKICNGTSWIVGYWYKGNILLSDWIKNSEVYSAANCRCVLPETGNTIGDVWSVTKNSSDYYYIWNGYKWTEISDTDAIILDNSELLNDISYIESFAIQNPPTATTGISLKPNTMNYMCPPDLLKYMNNVNCSISGLFKHCGIYWEDTDDERYRSKKGITGRIVPYMFKDVSCSDISELFFGCRLLSSYYSCTYKHMNTSSYNPSTATKEEQETFANNWSPDKEKIYQIPQTFFLYNSTVGKLNAAFAGLSFLATTDLNVFSGYLSGDSADVRRIFMACHYMYGNPSGWSISELFVNAPVSASTVSGAFTLYNTSDISDHPYTAAIGDTATICVPAPDNVNAIKIYNNFASSITENYNPVKDYIWNVYSGWGQNSVTGERGGISSSVSKNQ